MVGVSKKNRKNQRKSKLSSRFIMSGGDTEELDLMVDDISYKIIKIKTGFVHNKTTFMLLEQANLKIPECELNQFVDILFTKYLDIFLKLNRYLRTNKIEHFEKLNDAMNSKAIGSYYVLYFDTYNKIIKTIGIDGKVIYFLLNKRFIGTDTIFIISGDLNYFINKLFIEHLSIFFKLNEYLKATIKTKEEIEKEEEDEYRAHFSNRGYQRLPSLNDYFQDLYESMIYMSSNDSIYNAFIIKLNKFIEKISGNTGTETCKVISDFFENFDQLIQYYSNRIVKIETFSVYGIQLPYLTLPDEYIDINEIAEQIKAKESEINDIREKIKEKQSSVLGVADRQFVNRLMQKMSERTLELQQIKKEPAKITRQKIKKQKTVSSFIDDVRKKPIYHICKQLQRT